MNSATLRNNALVQTELKRSTFARAQNFREIEFEKRISFTSVNSGLQDILKLKLEEIVSGKKIFSLIQTHSLYLRTIVARRSRGNYTIRAFDSAKSLPRLYPLKGRTKDARTVNGPRKTWESKLQGKFWDPFGWSYIKVKGTSPCLKYNLAIQIITLSKYQTIKLACPISEILRKSENLR